MNLLVIGSGGREHALCWALSASPLVTKLVCAPGNPGIAQVARLAPVNPVDLDAVLKLCRDEHIDFVVIGPEAPLVAGLVDHLEAHGFACFGPSKAAAQLEGSKGFMKDLCAKYGIPTAAYGRFREAAAAEAFIRRQGAPIVVKADGLAAGKGVTVATTLDEALAANTALFAEPGAEVVIEEFLDGEEVSFFALVDGRHALALASAQDHKRVGDGDTGPNTGGMGAYSPAPVLTPALQQEVMDRIILPTVNGMIAEGTPFKGVLFAGLMLTKDGPKLLEYNTRFGDPECQTLMLRLKSDLLPALMASRDGVLKDFDLRWRDEAALCVVMAAEGYPGEPRKDTLIEGLDAAAAETDTVVFHAGTKAGPDGAILANGGRVLGVCGLGKTIGVAQARAYAAVDKIRWPHGFCRRDIGWRAIAREKN
ncbi:MAG: phosphoribosylamine--glycine ligase [Ferrovibrio sp.]|uniref:phosphoribosylamine--glycine ligase n=1 Tax=Ferrovibrio sp. TaxID=1917215 RepID=UPI002638DC85|nr:phosphoribosylamine--glycine ligase [Ferrovibrio sp.]MCW0232853.1 phosphoribosylamine--glycine ligase [Ferrovibrio sp.]